jgi:hypothetical protein
MRPEEIRCDGCSPCIIDTPANPTLACCLRNKGHAAPRVTVAPRGDPENAQSPASLSEHVAAEQQVVPRAMAK